jgi:hypothetical protein
MLIFGQVWFACLVGFAVGVVLDWVVRVRPLSRRVSELEARLSTDRLRSGGERGGSVFDSGVFSPTGADANGFVADRNRGGLLTPSGRGGTLVTDSRDDDDRSAGDRGTDPAAETEVRSGVEDFPGVSRLSGAWESEAEEATRAAPEPPEPWHPNASGEPWQPNGPAVRAAEESWLTTPQPAVAPEAGDNWLTEPDQAGTIGSTGSTGPIDDSEPTSEADQQYLEFLRAGANHAPTDPDVDEDGYDTGEQPGLVTHGEVAEPGSTEVTSVLPYPITDDPEQQPQVEGYEAYESYAQGEYQQQPEYQQGEYQQQPEYQQGEYQQNGYQETYQDAGYDLGYQFGEYQPEEVEEPEESTPLPRRGTSGENSMRFTPFAPFQLPFESQEQEQADVAPRNGALTPIEEGGFQPFEKPSGVTEGQYDVASDGAWIGDDGQLAGIRSDAPATNGAYPAPADEEVPAGESSWFDFSDLASAPSGAEGSLTQRMLPVSRPDLDHPDLLRESVFGTEADSLYDEDAPSRSLFEPVIPPDELEDDFRAPTTEEPAYEGYQEQDYGDYQNGYQEQDGYDPQSTPAEPTDEYLGQAVAPHPVRVRTGVEVTQSMPAIQPVPRPDEGQADQEDGDAAGPFGPGSALPLADGSAPAPQFRIKARTSSMVFHTESSPFYDRLEPQVWFRDAEDAQRAGFTSWERPRSW